MRLPRRRGTAATGLAAVLLTTTLPATAASPSAAPGVAADLASGGVAAPVPSLDWQPCGEGLEPFLCTTAEVPEDYDDPTGATSTIALTKLPASDAGRRIGSLFTNPGGPGGSGVDFVQTAAFVAYSDEVRARFDVIGFDPRGVARSTPATCFRTAEQEAKLLPVLAGMPFPVTPREETAFIGSTERLATRCSLTAHERFDSSSTANVARDMDLLRQAVGDAGLTYAGYSYGTFLGATYAKLFPTRVRAMFVDGTIDPETYVGDPDGDDERSVGSRLRQGEGADDTFREFARLCAEGGPQTCPLAALGDPQQVWEDLLARLRQRPVVVPVDEQTTVVLDYATTVATAFPLLYEPVLYPVLADFVAQLSVLAQTPTATVAQLRATTRALADAGLIVTTGGGGLDARVGEEYPSVGGNLASLCADTAEVGRRSAYPAIADADDAAAPHFGRYRAWVGLQCESLDAEDPDAYLGPWDQETQVPVLVAGTSHDPATPYAATPEYAASFPDGRLLTVEGWGHTTLAKSSCVDAYLTRYLVDVVAPASGTVCAQDVVPFAPPAMRALGGDGAQSAREVLERLAVMTAAR